MKVDPAVAVVGHVAVPGDKSISHRSVMFGGIGRAASIIALVYVVGLIVTPFAGPETKGRPLPE